MGQFYPRDAKLARVYATAVPSVCVSHACFVLKRLTFYGNYLPPDSHIILVFFVTEGRCLTLTASLLVGTPNTRG